jgi:threonine dehydrogenase-like Zn-dependent dehydrogenase
LVRVSGGCFAGDADRHIADLDHCYTDTVDVAKPRILEDRDVILKVTGTTVCGSDLHLLHGTVIQMKKGDILGHEFCGIVDQVGPGVTNIKVGKRYVAAFQITCGEVNARDKLEWFLLSHR